MPEKSNESDNYPKPIVKLGIGPFQIRIYCPKVAAWIIASFVFAVLLAAVVISQLGWTLTIGSNSAE